MSSKFLDDYYFCQSQHAKMSLMCIPLIICKFLWSQVWQMKHYLHYFSVRGSRWGSFYPAIYNPSIIPPLAPRDKSIKGMTEKERVHSTSPPIHTHTLYRQTPFSNTWAVRISPGPIGVQMYDTFTWRPCKRGKWKEEGREGGGGVKWKRCRGTTELYKSKWLHLIIGFWQKRGWKVVVMEGGMGRWDSVVA